MVGWLGSLTENLTALHDTNFGIDSMKRQAVITGLGIISPVGIGKVAFQDALFNGVSGLKNITLFDTTPYNTKIAGEVTNFAPQDILGPKGLRTLDRSTKLVMAASKLCLDDANLTINEESAGDIGVAVGSVFGSIKSVSDFDRDALLDGPRYVNPAYFPNTVINSPASEVSIRFNIKGFNATLSTGFCASLDAINYAADFIRLGRALTALAGGTEELCEQLFIGFYETGCMAIPRDEAMTLSCPFDKRRNGLLLGEGSAIVALEDVDAAIKRGAKIYAQLKGFCATPNQGGGMKRSMVKALERSQLDPGDIDLILAGANSSSEGDRLEAQAIKEVFQRHASTISVSAVKSLVGEQYGNAGAFQVATAACLIEKQMVFPTVNYEHKDPDCDLNIVTKTENKNIGNILINTYEKDGSSSSLVVSKFES